MVVRPSTVSEKWESKGSWVLSSNCCRSLTHDRGQREKYQQIYQRLAQKAGAEGAALPKTNQTFKSDTEYVYTHGEAELQSQLD